MLSTDRQAMRKRKLQIFLSSTYEDLIGERLAAMEAVLAAGHIPAAMEQFSPPVTFLPPWSSSRLGMKQRGRRFGAGCLLAICAEPCCIVMRTSVERGEGGNRALSFEQI
jgi:hypothetical protein